MFVVIYDPHTGETFLSRRLSPTEILDERIYAERYAASCEQEIDDTDNGHIFAFEGDFRVEIRLQRENSVHIWSGESFYFKREDY